MSCEPSICHEVVQERQEVCAANADITATVAAASRCGTSTGTPRKSSKGRSSARSQLHTGRVKPA